MYGNTYYRQQKRQKGSYFMPFLWLIALVIIGVLLFQIINYFRQKSQKELENKAAIEIISGRAEMKIWELEQWSEMGTGTQTILHEGDAIRTFPGSRVVMTLLNGSTVRLGSESEIELTSLKTRDGQDDVSLHLRSGDAWLKRSSNDTVHAQFSVTTDHLEASALGTTFAITQGPREAVRVIDGNVQVVVRVPEPGDDTTRIAETLDVAFGQEVSLGKEEVLAIQNKTPVDLLDLLSDTFRDSEWYKWNRLQDEANNPGLTVQDAVQQLADEAKTEAATPVPESTPEAPPAQVVTTPIITTPTSNPFTTKTPLVTIEGSVGSLTDNIEVTTYIAGQPQPYVLKKYKSGSTKWSYVASRDLGNLLPGENVFLFIAIDKSGTRTNATKLTINYDAPTQPADLSPPKVVSFNGVSSPDITGDSVEMVGTIGKGIVQVFVNNFALTRYVPDSGEWRYTAKKEYGNFIDGANTFNVYGVGADGTKTPITSFVVTKKPAAVTPTP